jgi:16S rRNA (guanine527-N7)-methyltransferase
VSKPDPQPEALRQALAAGLEGLGLGAVAEVSGGRLLRFVELLANWNRVFNLTAVRDPRAMIPRHILDSLTLLPHLRGATLLDVGTGAGLPGIPLALARPQLRVTLLDANAKRTRFLTHALVALAIDNATVVTARAEHYRPGIVFDTVVARAVADLAQLASLVAPLTAAHGRLIAMKGRHPEAELAALDPQRWRVSVQRALVPGLDAERHLIILDRRAGSGDSGAH